jgi:hypothetical protein
VPPPLDPILQQELATYEQLLPTLSADEGRFALIAGENLLGVYGAYLDALEAGYRARGLKPFLVKQIATFELRPFFNDPAS